MARGKAVDGSPVIIERVAADWLGMTTFSYETYLQWVAIIENMNMSQPAVTAFKQYSGTSWSEGVSLVEGEQKKGAHYIFTASGAQAEVALQFMRQAAKIDLASVKCIRLDAQITLPRLPGRPDIVLLAHQTKAGAYGEFIGRGKPSVTAHMGKDGDTMYIGARVSELFARIYDKFIKRAKKAVEHYERYEVELKGSRAQSMFDRLMSQPPATLNRPLEQLLKASIEKLPPGLAPLVAAAGVAKTDYAGLMPEHTPRGKGNRTKWVETIGDALAFAASAPGDDGRAVRAVLLRAFRAGLPGAEHTLPQGWAVVSPNGQIYNFEGEAYNVHSQSGGVTFRDIHNSKIHIGGGVVGNDTTAPAPPAPAPDEGLESG